MTILQVKCFLAVCEHRRYAEAAERLGLPQPALVRQLRILEEEVCAKLFEKERSGLRLSAAGNVLYPHFIYLNREYKRMLERLHAVSTAESASLLLGSMYFLKQYNIIQMIREFSRIQPGIHIEISEYRAHELEELMRLEKLDACFGYREMLEHEYIEMIPVCEDYLCALVNREHRFAGRKSVRLAELKDEPMVLMRGDPRIYRQLLAFCAEEGVVPREYNMDLRNETIKEWIASGNGISLFMGNMADDLLDERLDKLLIEGNKRLTLVLAVRRDSGACRLFANYVANS